MFCDFFVNQVFPCVVEVWVVWACVDVSEVVTEECGFFFVVGDDCAR